MAKPNRLISNTVAEASALRHGTCALSPGGPGGPAGLALPGRPWDLAALQTKSVPRRPSVPVVPADPRRRDRLSVQGVRAVRPLALLSTPADRGRPCPLWRMVSHLGASQRSSPDCPESRRDRHSRPHFSYAPRSGTDSQIILQAGKVRLADRRAGGPSHGRRSAMTRIGTVGELRRYPVKSMLGETLERAEVRTRGLSGDRVCALIDAETGRVASAKMPRR